MKKCRSCYSCTKKKKAKYLDTHKRVEEKKKAKYTVRSKDFILLTLRRKVSWRMQERPHEQ